MPKAGVGDIVTIDCKVTKVLDDKRIVIRLPGVETPVTIFESSVSTVQKKPAGPKKPTMPRGWKPPRDVAD